MLTLSVIVSYYKQPDNLKLILKALAYQIDKDFEIIVAEDDNIAETKDIINSFKETFQLKIIHVWQEDKGFRKNKILNKAVTEAGSDFLVFIDGDCIPEKHFTKQYKKNASENSFLIGRRVWLSEKNSKKLKQTVHLKYLNLVYLVFSGSSRIEEAVFLPFLKKRVSKRGLCGCNWAVFRKDLLKINGFDETYIAAGVGEDVDIEWRLMQNNMKRLSVRNKAIVYHLYHKKIYSEEKVKENYKIFYEKQKQNLLFCKNGIEKVTD